MKSRQAEANALVISSLTVVWIFVSLRVYVRCFLSKSFGTDDWLLLAALGAFTTYGACALAGIVHGIGRHPEDITKEELPNALFYWWISALFYTVTTVLVRASICVFLEKICVKKLHKIIIWSTMGVVLAFSTFYFFLEIFQCNPPDLFWQKFRGMTKGNCKLTLSALPAATYAHSVISAVADWVLGLLPLWLIWDLKMNIRTKVSVGVILGLGVIAGIAAIIRIPYVRILGQTDDFLYAVFDVSFWSVIEAALGLTAASATALRPLFKCFYDISSYSQNSQSRHNPSHGGYMRNQSVGRSGTRDGFTSKYDREDSLELGGGGMGNETTAKGGIPMRARSLKRKGESRPPSPSESEKNLTWKNDIFVHTVIEVDSGHNDRDEHG